jgi:TPR repeat protein
MKKIVIVLVSIVMSLYAGEFEENQKACDAKESYGCYNLAVHYANNDNGQKDMNKSMKFFDKSCTFGEVDACTSSAKIYLNALYGIASNVKKSIEFYEKSCILKDSGSCILLASLYDIQGSFKGIEKFGKVDKDEIKSIGYYEKACEYDIKGKGKVCTTLGIRLEDADGYKKDLKKAFNLYTIGCEKGDANGCGLLAASYKEGMIGEKNLEKASQYYSIACDGNMFTACTELGFMYLQGNGVKLDKQKASTLNKKACQGGVGFSCMTLGVMSLNGDGMKKDKQKAIAFFKQACDLGDVNGCSKYKVLVN